MSETNTAPVVDAAPSESTEVKTEAPPQPPAKKKYTYKSDGQEFSEELDDNEVQSRLSLSKAAQSRMKEAAEAKKEKEEIIKALKENPLAILQDDRLMGKAKTREVIEKYLADELKREMMSPEEIKRMEMEAELSKYKESEKKQKEDADKKQAEVLESKYAQQYQKTIIDALEGSGLPKNARTIGRMASLLQKNLQHGLDLEPSQLAQIVKQDFEQEFKAILGTATPEQLLAVLGPEAANAIRKHDLAKFKSPVATQAPKTTETTQQPERRMSPREYTEYLNNKFKK